ncbi:receptor-type tyrosine-protein phosphatase F-like isoform X2 [Dendronephthya gigantea]|uniref:receptor-type tyrosine-protein phosphatase F-like isoform X2 n=1 Tax=Dendronephthya gigantea TaxID=151771 RepID=UPI00106BF582|nr:receptor-type tyrosine-protein phosphatase F-like isoform X2 [Dendronephthya gigantea]
MSCRIIQRWLIVFGLSLMAVEDCQSFFMRQSSSPKECITREESLIYNEPRHALPSWVIMTDNCLDDKAQFRYKNTEILWHIESGGALFSTTAKSYRNRLAIYVAISTTAKDNQKLSSQKLKQTSAGSLYFYNDGNHGICAELSGDYLYRRTYCDGLRQTFTFGSVTKYGNKMKDVNCSPKQRMVIHKAYYGNFNNSGAFNSRAQSDAQCTAVTSCRLKSLCGGKKSCELTVDNNLLPNLCPNTREELYTEYTCVDNYTSPVTTTVSGLQIRLSSGYIGYLYIYEKTWVIVSEENLDENSERWICQHLGFQDRLNNRVSFGNARNGRSIVAGDLVCYNTQSGETSCCVYLQRKTAKSAEKLPYVECKICDNQLLNDEGNFPNSIFDGNGGNDFLKARFTKTGWCSSTPGSYLTIDLQKEYHITRVVVMGDKDQTKWSGSYSLKYSHDESFVDEIQIKGNQNGYQASTTDVDIYNVRYIKIQSTGNTDFCLRIELCGVVQRPGSVYDVRINPSKNSALVTWKLPTSSSSSYIKNLKIYLDRRHLESVQRGNEYNISNLRPYASYEVGIEAVDDYRQKSRVVYKTFRTKEAAPSERPYNVKLTARSQTSLKITWAAPRKSSWNAEKLTGFEVCYYIHENIKSPICISVITTSAITTWKTYTYTINGLQLSTKYFVTVSAATVGGVGPKSTAVSGITDGEPVKLLEDTSSTLRINISKQADYIKSVIIIVKIDSGETTPVENIKTNSLRSNKSTSDGKPYITAYLKSDVLPKMFVIGDGEKYNSKTEIYSNQPLTNNTKYIAFLRFFESEEYNNEYYSTAWSKSVKTSAKPPAPFDLNVKSTDKGKYKISWSISLRTDQTVTKYDAALVAATVGSKKKPVEISTNEKSVTVDVNYDTKYTFEIRLETEAGSSELEKKTWFSHSEPIAPQKNNDGTYTVILTKPKVENIRTVSLVVLRLPPASTQSPAPEDVELKGPDEAAGENDAFVAKEYNISQFKSSNTIEIVLRKSSEKNKRRKRDADEVYELKPDATYRSAQMNEDKSEKRFWSFWSAPMTFDKDEGTGDGGEREETDDSGSGSGGSIGIAVGGTFAAIAIVAAVIIAVLFFRRRRRRTLRQHKADSPEKLDEMKAINVNGNKYDDEPEDVQPVNGNNECIYSNDSGNVDRKGHQPVPIAEFAHYVNELRENENHEFQKEYNALPKDMNISWEVSKKPFNKSKNRYGNIVTYDHSRVVLEGDEKNDYINASHIDGINEGTYIASQGPRANTVNDMWRMVWEQRSYSIVMVTSLVELGKPKCEKYWPDNGSKMYGDIEVTLMKTEEFAYHVTHTLELKKDDEEREVRQYYFQSWPDHGVPKYPTQLLAFRRHFRTYHFVQSGPIIVHCSAGVGRTGVFLTIDIILDKLEKGAINSIDIFGEVCAMRERRMNMVQTLEQYIFIHEAILETVLCGMNEIDSTKIQKEFEALANVKASGMTGFQEKFKRLGEVSPKLVPEECTAALLEGNRKKNRHKNIYPTESNRVPLQYVDGQEDSDYINAVFVHGYLGRNYFIATQSPLPNTINDFWRLVHYQKSSTIVLLSNVKGGTSFPKFWPNHRGEPKQYDSLTVQLDSEKESNGIWTRKFVLAPYPDLSDGRVVNIFHYTKWPDHGVPPDGNGVIALTSLVENSRKSHGHGPIIVACSDGAGRTGTYIAISNLLERMKIEQAMDVFQAIKIIRGIRPQFVENAEQYEFCYTAIMAYLDSFSEYANFGE